jgi:DNA-binding FrmR family transcriptional regulator
MALKISVSRVQHQFAAVVFSEQMSTMTNVPAALGEREFGDEPLSMLELSEQQALLTRLNRVEGQIRGIRRMVQEPRPCIEILQQLAAAEAALNRISLAIFKHHVETCVTEALSKGESERRKEMSELVDIFDRFAK